MADGPWNDKSPNSDETRMADAVATGDTLAMLLAMREMLAERFDKASPRDSASIARQLQMVIEHVNKLNDGHDLSDDKLEAFLNGSWEAE